MTNRLLLLAALAISFGTAPAAELATPLVRADLDPAAFSEWVDGKAAAIGADRLRDGPAGVVWTRDSQPDWIGGTFGDSRKAGIRHLRIGFAKELRVGTVIACGGALSVLKPGVAYPGDPGDDSQWLAAQRQT